MRWFARFFPILTAPGLAAALAACAQLTPQAATPVAPPSRLASSSMTRNTLLSDLAHCGLPASTACARIHAALAEVYLTHGPLDTSALGNAARELDLAAQNNEVGAGTLSLRRVVHALQERRAGGDACVARLKKVQAQSAVVQARLDRLENLLHDHAEKSLDHHVLRQP
ncbi:hypothetical protein HF285_05970 [Acidithiobacillus ferrooxidans F221]|jgi:hypothetical protein|uniref:hypothetical protein n=1 Tax=Acidithiobacillus ferrooxidans TaxID=920 RepID=UPI001C074D92|nr:hypothetical protein [Acidithiobacillus ferrooxidans]MBU2807825.1 hypothetical protein [Acidithiobacillus ferrooxidans F221]